MVVNLTEDSDEDGFDDASNGEHSDEESDGEGNGTEDGGGDGSEGVIEKGSCTNHEHGQDKSTIEAYQKATKAMKKRKRAEFNYRDESNNKDSSKE